MPTSDPGTDDIIQTEPVGLDALVATAVCTIPVDPRHGNSPTWNTNASAAAMAVTPRTEGEASGVKGWQRSPYPAPVGS